MAKKKNKSIHCANCNFQFKEVNNFCPNCGQENHSHNVPLKELFLELLESTLHFDTKLVETLKTGFSKPGKIISDFNIGKRVRYVPPFRFYIFISVLFFLAFGFFSGEKDSNKNSTSNIKKKLDTAKLDTSKTSEESDQLDREFDFDVDEEDSTKLGKENFLAAPDSAAASKDVGESEFEKKLTEKFKQYMDYGDKEKFEKFTKLTSYFMFFFMPFSALFLALLYIRKRKNYYEHLIFSIYTHAFIFIIFIFALITNYFIESSLLNFIFILSAYTYFLLSLKNVHAQSWRKTIFKFFILSFLYLFSGFILFLISILAGIYFI